MNRVFVDTSGFLGLLVAEDAHHDRANALFEQAKAAYSLCDALSFVVMERMGISQAIAFDRHFHEYGKFTVL